jgi:riboflavin kinase/FMN adenylyltransferase
MQHFHNLDDVYLQDVWLTIGSFDGVHLGHQEIIRNLTAEAHKHRALAAVLTFFPHPSEVLSKRDFAFYLTNPNEKAHLLSKLGVDVVITHPFDQEIAATPALDFIRMVHDHLKFTHLHIGYDFALGHNREGNAEELQKFGEKLGFHVKQIPPLEIHNQTVSSSRIRFLLGAGQVQEAAKLLGREFQVEANIVYGDQRGRTIGFPTANLDLWTLHAMPAAGVYACLA